MHQVGVFAQIHEMQDMDYKLRLVVMAHRRIKITGQFIEDEIETGPAGKFISVANTFSGKKHFYL